MCVCVCVCVRTLFWQYAQSQVISVSLQIRLQYTNLAYWVFSQLYPVHTYIHVPNLSTHVCIPSSVGWCQRHSLHYMVSRGTVCVLFLVRKGATEVRRSLVLLVFAVVYSCLHSVYIPVVYMCISCELCVECCLLSSAVDGLSPGPLLVRVSNGLVGHEIPSALVQMASYSVCVFIMCPTLSARGHIVYDYSYELSC